MAAASGEGAQVIQSAFGERGFYKFPVYPHRCSFPHDYCIETEHHGLSQALTEEWFSRLYEPGTLLGSSDDLTALRVIKLTIPCSATISRLPSVA